MKRLFILLDNNNHDSIRSNSFKRYINLIKRYNIIGIEEE